MGGPGSGRKAEKRQVPSRPCPPLTPDHAACRAVSAWVVEQIALGTLDNRAGDVILAGVSRVTTSLSRGFNETELEKLEALVRFQAEAMGFFKHKEDVARSAATNAARPITGRTRVGDLPGDHALRQAEALETFPVAKVPATPAALTTPKSR